MSEVSGLAYSSADSPEALHCRCGGGGGGRGGAEGDAGKDGGNTDPGGDSNIGSIQGSEGEYGDLDGEQLAALATPDLLDNKRFCYAWFSVFGSLPEIGCDMLRPLPPGYPLLRTKLAEVMRLCECRENANSCLRRWVRSIVRRLQLGLMTRS